MFALVLIGAAAFIAIGYRNATAMPLVRRLSVTMPGYPPGGVPLRIVLFSDVHVHDPDMPPSRVTKIVDQINALHPDLDVAAGDFVGNAFIGSDYSPEEAIAPLRGLKARLGVYAVLGNNDYEAGEGQVSSALANAGVQVLNDDALKVGPVALGGMDGRIHRKYSNWIAARDTTHEALDATPGMKILVAHRPDEFVAAPNSISLVLAGHTHCGQIVLPLLGPMETGSDYGRKYSCGVVRDGSKLLVVTAGIGTSHVPLRIGAPPDIWLITIQGPKAVR